MGSRGHLNGPLYVHSDHWPEMAPGSLPGSELVVKINKITSTFSFFCNKQTTCSRSILEDLERSL